MWNVGAFFRTSDALSIEKIYLTGYTAYPPRKEIAKVALGADETVPFEHAEDPIPVLRQLKEEGWQLVALELTPTAVDLTTFHPSDKLCLIVGHELSGIPDEQISLCDITVKIPMLGQKESLNVAIATGIALYQLRHSK